MPVRALPQWKLLLKYEKTGPRVEDRVTQSCERQKVGRPEELA